MSDFTENLTKETLIVLEYCINKYTINILRLKEYSKESNIILNLHPVDNDLERFLKKENHEHINQPTN